MISNMQLTSDGTGTMGLGDQSFAVSVESVRQAEDQTAGFVANFATSWRTRTAAQIPATSTVGRSTPLSCYDCRGFCIRSVQGKEVVYERTLAYFDNTDSISPTQSFGTREKSRSKRINCLSLAGILRCETCFNSNYFNDILFFFWFPYLYPLS